MSKILYKRYTDQRFCAKRRGILFLLTFEEWLYIWETSGHLSLRGRLKGQYCMARFGDQGAYQVGNVRIITVSENRAETQLSDVARAKMSRTKTGKKLSIAHRCAIARGNTGKRHTVASIKKISESRMGVKNPRFGISLSAKTKAKLSAALTGKKRSPEARERIRIAKQKYWDDRRAQESSNI